MVAVNKCCLASAVATPNRGFAKRQQQAPEVVRGVNIGGFLVLEPWIRPSLFREWNHATSNVPVDEWSFCAVLGKQECSRRLRQHWEEWVQESDIQTLSSMHINTLRIPIGYWALVPSKNEPYVQGQIPYLRRVLEWAKKYAMRVILDLHGVPGSQNGFDNSGRRGDVKWTKDPTDIPRTLDALGVLAEVANEYPLNVVAIQAVNEPANWGVPKATIAHFYQLAYRRVKSVAPQIALVFHDAFLPDNEWESLVPQNLTDSLLDTHIYHVFSEEQLRLSPDEHVSQACKDGSKVGGSNGRVRTICGEFSLATTDCALWLNGFQRGARWDGSYLTQGPVFPDATCQGEEDLRYWSRAKREAARNFAMAQIQSYERGTGWIFWNFKTENAATWDFIRLTREGIIPSPPFGNLFNVCPLSNRNGFAIIR
ncbi:hypothetical protein LPJ56_000369 [Coemansia sp. RSA 2599]|nr:hypothetical protein LPJ75_000117 [Coemansia sp. RSA 2598]KAJ1829427.1 hypothetical protein LPJ56_000369 [Coemansia sp. RSA 2599]